MDETMMRQVAWIGDSYVQGKIRGVALAFHGLDHVKKKAPRNGGAGMGQGRLAGSLSVLRPLVLDE